jgi:Putative beta barrel porin-7 (BBP7)
MRSAVVSLCAAMLAWMTASPTFAQDVAATPAPEWSTAGRFRIGVEGLAWWFKDSPLPVPVVTDGLVGGTATQTLLGGKDLSTGANPGFRISADYALSNTTRLEGNFFYFGTRSKNESVASTGEIGSTDLIVPYFDALSNTESGTEISLAPVYRGNASEKVTSNLLGAEINGAWAMAPSGAWRTDLLGGFRYLRLHETYTLTTSSPFNPAFGQDVWDTTDQFGTTNDFYGLQAGARAHYDQGPFFADGSLKVALGAMAQSVNIAGSLVTNDFTNFGPTQTFAGGYFALPTNIGNYSRTTFAVVPEIALNLGYRITPAASIVVGYSFIYASNVVRPGNQINRTVNTTQSTSYTEDPASQLQGTAQPSFKFNDGSFWAQGISVGLVVRF